MYFFYYYLFAGCTQLPYDLVSSWIWSSVWTFSPDLQVSEDLIIVQSDRFSQEGKVRFLWAAGFIFLS